MSETKIAERAAVQVERSEVERSEAEPSEAEGARRLGVRPATGADPAAAPQ